MKTRRLLATVLAIAMLASLLSVPVLAEEAVPTLVSTATGDGYICEDLGILIGTGDDGVTEDYLDTLAMRTQAAMINLRLFGLEAAALAFDGEETFTDAADATEYWQSVLEYLKANPSIGWVGDEDGNFLPNDYVTGQAFTKILLVALGYEYGLDFDWETTMDFAAEVGLTALADKAGDDLTVREIAAAIVEALGTKYNDTRDITLISKLVLDEVIDAETAEGAGFVVEEPTMTIVNAYASATTEVTVVMNMDVPEGTVVTLKKGMSGYNVDMTTDSSTITLTAGYALPAGDWTVTVGEETMDFVIDAQTATGFSFGADFVYDTGTQDLMVTLADQYGDPMDLTGCTISVFNATDGFVFNPDASAKTVKIDVTENGAVDDEDEISIFIFDPDSGETASNTYAVMETPYLASGTIGEITLGDEDAVRLTVGSTDNILDLEGFDQYGNPYEITIADLMSENVQILESNDPVLSLMSIVDGDLVFDAVTEGFTTLTFVLPFEAFIASSDVIQVWAQAELTELAVGDVVITEEQVGLFVSESALVTVDGFDQYGDAISFDGDDDIWFTTTNPSMLNPEFDIVVGDDTVTVYPQATGTCTVFVFLNGLQQGSFTVSAEAAAYPFKITNVETVGALETDAYFEIVSADFTVEDQYGREIDSPFTNGWSWVIDPDTDEDYVYLADWLWGVGCILATTPEAGTDTFTAYLSTGGAKVVGNSFTFSVQNVATESIVSFSLDVVDDMLYCGDQDWDLYGQMFIYNNYTSGSSLYPYDNPWVFTGYLEDGTEVALALDGGQVPYVIDVITYSTENPIDYDYMTRTDYPYAPTIYASGLASNPGLTVMKIWIDGEMVASDEFTVSVDDYAVTSIEATDDVLSWTEVEELLMGRDAFWPPEIYSGPEEWGMAMAMYLGDSEDVSWYARYLGMEMITIKDQYGVELFWMPLLEEGLIQFMCSSEVIGDDIYFYFTVLTPGGMIYDTVTIKDDFVPEYLLIGPPPIPEGIK